MSNDDLARFRNRNVGFVFQFHHLLPEFTALENVAMPGWIGRMRSGRGVEASGRAARRARLGREKPALPESALRRRAAAGGHRPGLARRPALFLADEPTGNLDLETSERVFELMRECHDEARADIRHSDAQPGAGSTLRPSLRDEAARVKTDHVRKIQRESPPRTLLRPLRSVEARLPRHRVRAHPPRRPARGGGDHQRDLLPLQRQTGADPPRSGGRPALRRPHLLVAPSSPSPRSRRRSSPTPRTRRSRCSISTSAPSTS